jgi:beta-N-acetylglucosaminidase
VRRGLHWVSIVTVGAIGIALWLSRDKGEEFITADTNIAVTSPYSAMQIDKALSGIGASEMVGLGEAFKTAERESKIHALFLAAIAVHESKMGTSRIAREKNNLFGWGAVDDSPFDSAYSFASKEAGILHVASRLRAMYVNEWKLTTPSQIGTRYASDTQWAEKVTYWARRLQNEI